MSPRASASCPIAAADRTKASGGPDNARNSGCTRQAGNKALCGSAMRAVKTPSLMSMMPNTFNLDAICRL